jgi:large repetitive protein
VNDGQGGAASQTLTLTITPVNDAPVADGDRTITVAEDSTATALNIAAPTDVDGDSLAVTVAGLPTAGKGTVQLAGGGAVTHGMPLTLTQLAGLTFTPAENANGAAGSFSYTVTDGNGGTAQQTITLTITPVNDAPTADGDKPLTVDEDAAATSLGIAAPADLDGDTLTVTVTSIPTAAKGSVFLGANAVVNGATLTAAQLAQLTFVPEADANGAAGTFAYTVNDGRGGTAQRAVTISITPVNDAPAVQANKTIPVAEDSGATALNIAAPTDVEGDTLTITVTGLPATAKGTVQLAGGGAVTNGMALTSAQLAGLTFTPVANANGPAGSFSYSVSDGRGGTASQAVALEITPINDTPVVEMNRPVSLEEDSGAVALSIPSPTDVDGDTLTVTVTSIPDPAKGQVLLRGGGAVTNGATLTRTQLTELAFAPAPNANGAAGSFSYTVSDGQGGTAASSLSIAITPVNDAPTAQPNTNLAVQEDSGITLLGIAAPADVDGDALTITVTSVPDAAKGSVLLPGGVAVGAGMQLSAAQLASLSFSTAANAHGAAGAFAYSVNDGQGGSASQTVTLAVASVNDVPVAPADTALAVLEDSGASPLGIVRPTDADSDALTITVTALPTASMGSITLANGGAVTIGQALSAADLEGLRFTPALNANGAAGAFAYDVRDGQGGTAAQTLTLSVTAINDEPTLGAATAVQLLAGSAPVPLNVAAPSDVDGDALSIRVRALPLASEGAIQLPNGTALTVGAVISSADLAALRFAPAAGFVGLSGAFRYGVDDGSVEVVSGDIRADVLRQTIAFTGSFSFADADGDRVTVVIGGAGRGEVQLVNGLQDGADLHSLRLFDTDARTAVKATIKKMGAGLGASTVGSIQTAGAAQHLGAITLPPAISLGDGVEDSASELLVSGSLKKLSLGGVAANATLQIGTGLAGDAAIAALNPAIALGDVADGVALDVRGGIAGLTVGSWGAGGSVSTLSSISALTVKAGSFAASLDLDSAGTGPGIATLGKVDVKAGGFFSPEVQVEGAATSIAAKGAIATTLTAASLGSVTAYALRDSAFTLTSGGVGKIQISGPIRDSTFTAEAGTIGAISATLKNATAAGNAIESVAVEALGIGNITATIGGKAFAGGAAITGSSFTATGGNVGNITAIVSTGVAAGAIAGVVNSTFTATGSVGKITVSATNSNAAPTGGSAIAILAANGGATAFDAGTAIGAVKATASGSGGTNAALAATAGSPRIAITSDGSIGAITLTANRGKGIASATYALRSAEIAAVTTIAGFTAGGDASDQQVRDLRMIAGGQIGKVKVEAKTKVHGTLSDSRILAGQSFIFSGGTVAADLKNAALGSMAISGAIVNSTLAAGGHIGALAVAGDVSGSLIAAGANAGADRVLLTLDDSFHAHGSIASVKIGGALAATSIVAGTMPGADLRWGGGDDAAAPGSDDIVLGGIGAVTLGAATAAGAVSDPILVSSGSDQLFAISAFSIKSVKVGGWKVRTDFTVPLFIDANGDLTAQPAEIAIQRVSEP